MILIPYTNIVLLKNLHNTRGLMKVHLPKYSKNYTILTKLVFIPAGEWILYKQEKLFGN